MCKQPYIRLYYEYYCALPNCRFGILVCIDGYIRYIMRSVLVFSFIVAASTSSNEEVPARTLNLELDTSFIFDKGDAHSALVNGLRTLLSKIDKNAGMAMQTESKSKHGRRTYENQDESNLTLATFIKRVGLAVLKYSDEEFENLTKIMKTEIVKYLDPSLISFVITDSALKSFINDTFTDLLSSPPSELREKLENLLVEADDTPLARFFTVLSHFYSKEDCKQFKEVLIKFHKVNPTVSDLEDLVKDMINTVIVQGFLKLNDSDKALLSEAVRTDNNIHTEYRRIQKIKRLYKESQDFSGSEGETVILSASNSFEKNIDAGDDVWKNLLFKELNPLRRM